MSNITDSIQLCKYSDIFGKPKLGLHRYRVFDIAIFDVIGTLFLAYIMHLYYSDISYWIYLVGLFILSIILHRILCVKTTVDKYISTYFDKM